jgi:hypothetical protein
MRKEYCEGRCWLTHAGDSRDHVLGAATASPSGLTVG